MLPKLLLVIALVLIAGGSAQADDSFYEPPVEGGPQTSQGSGTR